jgi:hypothetical protein
MHAETFPNLKIRIQEGNKKCKSQTRATITFLNNWACDACPPIGRFVLEKRHIVEVRLLLDETRQAMDTHEDVEHDEQVVCVPKELKI